MSTKNTIQAETGNMSYWVSRKGSMTVKQLVSLELRDRMASTKTRVTTSITNIHTLLVLCEEMRASARWWLLKHGRRCPYVVNEL
jgi:hypothetical protein